MRRWILGAFLIGLALVVAGGGLLTDQAWSPSVAIGAGAASLVLFGIFFTPWWTAGIGIGTGYSSERSERNSRRSTGVADRKDRFMAHSASIALPLTKKKEVTLVEIIGFIVVVVLWVAFGAALLVSQSSIHDMWSWFVDRPLAVRIPVGIVFLPWVIGMWIWETSWPVAARGVLVGGLAWANVYAFSPWKPA